MTESKTDYERFKELFDSVGQQYTLFSFGSNCYLQIDDTESNMFVVFEFTNAGEFVAYE